MSSKILASLSCAALALFSVEDSHAGRVEETYNGDFQYGHYSESGKRIGVDIFEAAAAVPIGKAMTANVSVVRDVIAGASPILNEKNAQGQVVQVMSGASGNAARSDCGASICEQRDAITSGLTYYFDKASLNMNGGFSREHDYNSRYIGTNASIDLNKKLTTLNFGGSVAFDQVEPTNINEDCNPKCSKTSQQYLLGVSQVLDKDSILQSNMTFSYHSGYLSDPYKRVAFDGMSFALPNEIIYFRQNDTRPHQKFQWAWLTQYVRHFEQLNDAALHADYRFTTDDWGINSHTMELSWHQPIGAGWQVIPRFRYYTQDSADFYAPVFAGTASQYQYYSSDYRLAGFGTLSGGLKFSKEVTGIPMVSGLKFQAGVEYYDHKAAYQLGGNSSGNFADFNYYLVTASFNLKF